MTDARINYAVVGGFVLVMLAALLASIALLTGRGGGADAYITHLDSVYGVRTGTKVTYEGFVIGQVASVTPLRSEGRTSFRLSLEVRDGWPIPQGSVARVAASGILAAVTVDIKGGKSEAMLEPGSQIPGAPAANLFAVMNDMAGQVSRLNQEGLLPLLSNLNQRIDALGGVLEKQAPELMANLVSISADLAAKTPRITADVGAMTSTLSSQVVNEQNARHLTDSLRNMAELSAGLQDTRRKVDGAVGALDNMVAGNKGVIDASLKDLRYTLQTLARNIDSVAYNVDGTARNLQEFSRQIRENPAVLIGGNKPRDDGPPRR